MDSAQDEQGTENRLPRVLDDEAGPSDLPGGGMGGAPVPGSTLRAGPSRSRLHKEAPHPCPAGRRHSSLGDPRGGEAPPFRHSTPRPLPRRQEMQWGQSPLRQVPAARQQARGDRNAHTMRDLFGFKHDFESNGCVNMPNRASDLPIHESAPNSPLACTEKGGRVHNPGSARAHP